MTFESAKSFLKNNYVSFQRAKISLVNLSVYPLISSEY
jgi:hypothetical protein